MKTEQIRAIRALDRQNQRTDRDQMTSFRLPYRAESEAEVKMTRAIPVLVVEDMAASLAFWEEVLGFSRIIEIPHECGYGTVHLARDQVEIVCRSIESLEPDELPYAIGTVRVEVENLRSLLPKLAQAGFGSGAEGDGLPSVFEIPVREPGGHRIILAQVHSA